MNSRYMPFMVPAAPPRSLDIIGLKRAFFYIAVCLMLFSPFSQDPMAFAVGAVVPWFVLQLIARPGMPAAVVYIFIWQWMQIFARAVQSMVDGEALGAGLYGPNVERAYWYMLASVVAMALAFRMVLGGVKTPMQQDRAAYYEWRPVDLFILYIGMLFVATGCRYLAFMIPALDQPLDAFSRMKIVLLFMLFVTVMTTGRGANLLFAALAIETVMGFTGLLSDFRSVFIYLGLAALAARVQLKGSVVAVGAVCAGLLIFLALFWTAVKMEYREIATGSSESQNVKASLDDRFGYLGGRLASPDSIDWTVASYTLLNRLAYTDIFGSVIGVQETAPEAVVVRQWQDALEHVLKPRFLFPGKPPLSDTEVYVRLARGDSTEQMRLGTSISVGYMAENFVDFGFPGMLAGVFVIGILYSLVIRYILTFKVPWVMREGVVAGFVFSVAHNGVEMSLPKILGAAFMYFLVYALMARFAFPPLLNWLKGRSGAREPQSA